MLDKSEDLTQYLITIRLDVLDNPCLNKSFLCTYTELKKEFEMYYSEMKFEAPSSVLGRFSAPEEAYEKCLMIIPRPKMDLKKVGWICHDDPSELFKVQKELSDAIRLTNRNNYEFDVNYVEKQSTIHEGKLFLTMDDWTFKKGEEVIVTAKWLETQPYASTLYVKDAIKWVGAGAKPEEDRCFKLTRKKEIENNNPDYFCVYFKEDDMNEEITENKLLNDSKINGEEIKKIELAMSRFAAQTYANKINVRFSEAIVRDSVNKMANLPTNTIHVDSDLVNPIKTEVRDVYLRERHNLLNNEESKSLSPIQIAKMLDDLKQDVIKKTCSGVEVCVNAMNYCVDKGLLPLTGDREKFSMDKENPFNSIAPKIPIILSIPNKDSVGKKAVDEVAKLKGANEYFAEKLPSGKSGVPIHDDIKRAYNTILGLKEQSKKYENIKDVRRSCKADERNQISHVRRRISYMIFSGDNDIFFEYFGYLRDYQFKK